MLSTNKQQESRQPSVTSQYIYRSGSLLFWLRGSKPPLRLRCSLLLLHSACLPYMAMAWWLLVYRAKGHSSYLELKLQDELYRPCRQLQHTLSYGSWSVTWDDRMKVSQIGSRNICYRTTQRPSPQPRISDSSRSESSWFYLDAVNDGPCHMSELFLWLVPLVRVPATPLMKGLTNLA